MYEAQTESVIRQRMLGNCSSTLNKNEGSFLWDSLSPAAIEFALAYIELDRVITLGFPQTSYGIYLDYSADETGLTRLAATKATGQVTVSGTNGTVIPINTIFATIGGIQFKTTEQKTITAGTATIAIEAVIAGSAGNVAIGAISVIPSIIPGVTSVTNAAETQGGTDTETDAALLVRILEKVRNPATSGNANHYKQWAKSVAGVGDARVVPLWDGPGTVKVIIIDANKEPASEPIVTNVTEYIEEERPIGATVTVVSATPLGIDIVVTLTLDEGYTLEGVQEPVETSLTNYLRSIAFVKDFVSYAQIWNAILDTEGILDCANLTVNLETGNIPIEDTEVAVLGTVGLNE